MLGQPDKAAAEKYGVIAVGQMTKTDTARLKRLAELVDRGTLKVHVDIVFPLDKAPDAFTYQETGHPRGKVAIQIRS